MPGPYQVSRSPCCRRIGTSVPAAATPRPTMPRLRDLCGGGARSNPRPYRDHRLPLFCRRFWRLLRHAQWIMSWRRVEAIRGHAVAGRSVSSSRMQVAKWLGQIIRRGGMASAHAGTT
jgi:hypothetical protein